MEKEPERARCQGCGLEYFKIQLARFGRHAKSPYLCRTCAESEFNRLHKIHGDKFSPEGDKKVIF